MTTITVYASVDDLTAWTGGAAPVNAVALLRSASIRVAWACNRNPYGDIPNDTDTGPLRDATTAQATAWAALNIDPSTYGLDPAGGPVKKASILSGDVERDTTGRAAALQAATETLCTEAMDILLAAGLLWEPVPVAADPSDRLPAWGQDRFGWWPWPEPLSGEYEWPNLTGLL